MVNYLSIDIGGTYIKSALINDQKNLYGHQKIKTKKNIDEAILKQVEEIIATTLSDTSIDGIGISTAGIVDRVKGEIIYAGPTIYQYKGTEFKRRLFEMFHLPIYVENDVNAALLGEVWQGAAQNENQVYCITLGTGIGGAYYHHQIIDGIHHQANSVGYLLFDPMTKTNYEMRASTSALNKRILTEVGENVTTEEVFERAKQKDARSTAIIEDWSMEVAKGIAQIILLIDPKCIVIGGGISRQGDYLLHHIEKQLQLFLPTDFLKTELKIAQLYNDAALFGAVYPFFKGE
ncbi:ROK family protein [Bacillus sp. Gen3]|uniref:ROK family protein n=1 Tax=Heyndrickxia oleronia TaxID=38875 RepID=UPI0015D1E10F|nr:ROK family protein [Heyndrickxia oleronia]MBU5211522.1 ROK family protein [Heyndrickxia oleronia]NYV65614.1 ROK family protein [Bacillus sp. Gen3]